VLDRAKLLRELEQLSGKLFTDLSDEFAIALASWQRIIADSTFLYKIHALKTPLPLPTWTGKIDEAITISDSTANYRVIAIDGSQIYPDRHQGTSCFLLNIGTAELSYGLPGKSVLLNSIPYVFLGDEEKEIEHPSSDYVNLRREEFEFVTGCTLARHNNIVIPSSPLLLLWDGSLIFWHLETKDPAMRSLFLTRYFNSLYELYKAGIINASYISLPKNKELVNLIKAELSNGDLEQIDTYTSIDHIFDAHIANFFLTPGTHTTLFKHRSKITCYYPEPLQPYFFYLHTGYEIVRIELPAWIAHDSEITKTVAHIIYDQSNKGRGYPIALAEAHEQAVIKGPDREFFYHLIIKLGIQRKYRTKLSHKIVVIQVNFYTKKK
jgi:hypothetical protein